MDSPEEMDANFGLTLTPILTLLGDQGQMTDKWIRGGQTSSYTARMGREIPILFLDSMPVVYCIHQRGGIKEV